MTTRNSDEVALLKATATAGAETPSEVAERLGSKRTYSLLSYALTMAASLKFPEGPTDDVSTYIAELATRLSDDDQFQPEVAEALLRAVLGDAEQLEKSDPDAALALLYPLSQILFTDLQLG